MNAAAGVIEELHGDRGAASTDRAERLVGQVGSNRSDLRGSKPSRSGNGSGCSVLVRTPLDVAGWSRITERSIEPLTRDIAHHQSYATQAIRAALFEEHGPDCPSRPTLASRCDPAGCGRSRIRLWGVQRVL